jgi:antitoxin component of MazEF toxin-antitoxin module
MMIARVARHGNSLGVRLPKKKALIEMIKEGDTVTVLKCNVTAGELVHCFGVCKSKKRIQKMVEDARKGWKD